MKAELEQRLNSAAIAAVRVLAGTLWLANLNWKRPPDFGLKTGSGLARWVKEGIKHPVFGPYSSVLKNTVLPHFAAFGWMTLVVEGTLAVLLILGWRTRLVALVGVGASTAIALTILRTPNEWPWAYFLMIGIHLLLAAVSAGEHYGLDGLRGRSARPALLWLGVLGLVSGAAGVIASADDPFTAKFGSLVGARGFELKFFWFNLLAALLCLGIGVLSLIAWKTQRREPAMLAVLLAAMAALQVLAQWRGTPPNETGGLLGGNGGTLCLWLILAVGIGNAAVRKPST